MGRDLERLVDQVGRIHITASVVKWLLGLAPIAGAIAVILAWLGGQAPFVLFLVFLGAASAMSVVVVAVAIWRQYRKNNKRAKRDVKRDAKAILADWVTGFAEKQDARVEELQTERWQIEGERRQLAEEKAKLESQLDGATAMVGELIHGWGRTLDRAEEYNEIWREAEARFDAAYRTIANMDILLRAPAGDVREFIQNVSEARKHAFEFGEAYTYWLANTPAPLRFTPESEQRFLALPAIIEDGSVSETPTPDPAPPSDADTAAPPSTEDAP